MPRPIQTLPPGGYTPNGGIDELTQPLALAPEKWTSAFDVEPLPDAVRRRNGSIIALDALSPSIEHWPAFGVSTPVNTNNAGVAVEIVHGGAILVESVEFFVARGGSGSHRSDILNVGIYTDVAGVPGVPVTNFDFTKFAQINMSALAPGPVLAFQLVTFPMLTPTTLGAGTHWIILWLSFATPQDDLLVGGESPDTYAEDFRPVSGSPAAPTAGSVLAAGLRFRLNAVDPQGIVTAIYDYQQADGTQFHLLAYENGEIFRRSGSAVVLVGALDSAHGDEVIPSLATADDICFITNGDSTDPSKKFYTFGGAERFNNEGIAAPTANATLGQNAAGGNLPADTYYLDYYYWDNELQFESNKRWQGNLSAAPSQTTGGATSRLQITTLPATIARTNDKATHIRIAVFQQSVGVWVYSGVQVTLGTTSVDVTDINLFANEITFDHDPPPAHSIKVATSERQFIAGIEGFPNDIGWTRADGIDVDVQSYPLANRRRVGVEEGDLITALFLVPPSTVVVCKRNSIYALDADQPALSPETRLAEGIGAAGHRAGVVASRSLYAFSDADKLKGPWVWDGSSVQLLTEINRTVGTLNASRHGLVSCAHLAKADGRFQVWMLVSASASIQHDLVLVYDYVLQAWTRYRLTGSVIAEVSVGTVDELFLGGYDGRELQLDTGSSDAGTEIVGEVTLAPLHFGEIDANKIVRWLRFVSNQVADGTLSFDLDVDFGNKPGVTRPISITGGGAGILGTDVLDAFTLGGSGDQVRSEKFKTSGRVFSPRFASPSDWVLRLVAWGVQKTGRRQ